MTDEEKNKQTSSNLSENIHITRIGSNSVRLRHTKPSIKHKETPQKKLTRKEVEKLIKKAVSTFDKPIKGRKRVVKPESLEYKSCQYLKINLQFFACCFCSFLAQIKVQIF